MKRCAVGVIVALQLFAWLAPAQAQTWSGNRSHPPLWQIISVDATGENNWPYGAEDPAGDGLVTVDSDEASIDLRTAYADADSARVWLRAYVSEQTMLQSTAVAFFFIDSDNQRSTGGSADDTSVFAGFGPDPTSGGYDYVVGVFADGQLFGSWSYNDQSNNWTMQQERTVDLQVEAGVDEDPIRIGANGRGYFQISLAHGISGADQACDADFFVRIYNDNPPNREFGDEADEGEASCHPSLNSLGDPALLRTDACTVDADCPAGGNCVSGICIFDYACTSDNQCQAGEECVAGRCLRVVNSSCASDADCNGFVCVSGSCVSCANSGAATCASDLVCTSRGDCVNPANPMVATVASGGTSSSAPIEGRVRGGAFTCTVGTMKRSTSAALGVLLTMSLFCWRRRRND